MKIVVTGASGFVGQNLVPRLAASGVRLLLVGRRPEALAGAFPGHETCSYSELSVRAHGFDSLVHLAVVNSDALLPESAFWEVNVDLLIDVAKNASQAGVKHLINISSVHALEENNITPYAASKREGVRRLAEIKGVHITNVFLPAVYGDRWSGKLSILNGLPRWLANPLFQVLSALRPTVHVRRLAEFLLMPERNNPDDDIILSDGQHDNLVYRGVRRVGDLTFAALAIFFFWWGFALIWLLIRLESPGPGIFSQQRVGWHGEVFTCYKFRTMRLGTPQAATHSVSVQAVTRFGRFLRRTKLDEMPQIWNIIKNEMSLIGFRPCLPVQVELIEARRNRNVLKLKPGISGLAQVNGIDMSEPETLSRWDAQYMALQSLVLDLKIVLATTLGKGGGDNVSVATTTEVKTVK